MILSKAQAKQYYSVFNPFMLFLVEWFRERGLLGRVVDVNHVYTDYEVECALLDAVFREGGHLEAIDAFLEARKGKLSQEDIDVVLDWKHAISSEYYAVRRGEDVVFLDGADAYAVRGITHELDDRFLNLPIRVFTYLVPFQEHITYLTVMRPLSTRLPRNVEEELLARVTEAERAGRLMRTGVDLICGKGAVGGDIRQDPISDSTDSADVSDRVGPLAGLSWEQRQTEIERYRERLFDLDALLDSLDGECLPGEPTHGYRDMISRMDTQLLRGFARNHGVFDELTKEGYVDLMVDIFEPRLPKFTDDLRKLGIRHFRETRTLCEQGGELRFPKDEIRHHDDVPRPIFPHTACFDGGDEYVVVLSDEACALLESVDWDAEIARAERLEEALAFLDVATDHRGLIARKEAMEELFRRFPDVDVTDIEDAVERRSRNYLIHLVPMVVNGCDYLVAEDLLADDGKPYTEVVRDILSRRWVRRPVWPTPEQVAQGGLTKAWESYEEGRRLAAFLDEHIRDGHDAYIFSSEAVYTLVYALQHEGDRRRWLKEALSFFANGAAEEEELRPLLQDLYNALPNRYCNGAIPQGGWAKDATPRTVTPRRPKKKRPTKKRRR